MSRLSSYDFDHRLKAGQLCLTLVGMSNVGKSHWSQQLAAHGFTHLSCDDMIETQVAAELQKLGFAGGIADMAGWLGQPYDPQFTDNQQRYLELETESLQTILNCLRSRAGNVVIDTTGSVAHTSEAIRQALSDLTLVVYLEATPQMRQAMFELYMAQPKPVIWGELFEQQPSESNHDALARCYPALLNYRSGHYKAMADVAIGRDELLKLESVDDFLAAVRSRL